MGWSLPGEACGQVAPVPVRGSERRRLFPVGVGLSRYTLAPGVRRLLPMTGEPRRAPRRPMSRPVNPYIAGNPVGNSSAFIGRDDVLRAVLGVLGDPQHHGVVLYGQRRIGKTSILHHLAEWLPKNGGPRAIYFDLQDKAAWPVGKILAHLAEKIAEELGLPEPEPPED